MTKRELGKVPHGEHDLVSGRKANGTGNAPAVKISTKTVKAAATKDTRPLTGKAAIKAELQKVRAANEGTREAHGGLHDGRRAG
jgi:hypothetical protein